MRRPVFRSGRLAPLDGGSSRRSGVMRLCSSEQPAHISLIRRRSSSIVSRASASSGNPRCPPDKCSDVSIGQEIEGAVTNRLTAGPSISASIGAMSTYPVRTRRWTRKEYDRLIDLGILREDEPIELIGGQLIVSEPKTSLHATAVRLTADALRRAFGEGWLVCTQDPIAPDDESEPEPDVIVI